MPNNCKCCLSMSCQVDTRANSVAPTFTRQVDRSELQLNALSSLLVRKQRSPASDEECRIDIATHLIAPFSTLLFSSGGGRLAVHVDSVEGDFFGLPDGRFVRAARRSSYTSVGWKFLRKPGNSRGLEVDGNFVKNQVTVTLRSRFIAFYNNNFVCIHCHLLTPAECRKCALIRGYKLKLN